MASEDDTQRACAHGGEPGQICQRAELQWICVDGFDDVLDGSV
jgi:hypothetical protein